MNLPNPKDIVEGLERAAAVYRVLAPIAREVEQYLFGDGSEAPIFEKLPELRATAALERARYRAKTSSAG